jgi:hypothetical protein
MKIELIILFLITTGILYLDAETMVAIYCGCIVIFLISIFAEEESKTIEDTYTKLVRGLCSRIYILGDIQDMSTLVVEWFHKKVLVKFAIMLTNMFDSVDISKLNGYSKHRYNQK